MAGAVRLGVPRDKAIGERAKDVGMGDIFGRQVVALLVLAVKGHAADLAKGQMHRHDNRRASQRPFFEIIQPDLIEITVVLAGIKTLGVDPKGFRFIPARPRNRR